MTQWRRVIPRRTTLLVLTRRPIYQRTTDFWTVDASLAYQRWVGRYRHTNKLPPWHYCHTRSNNLKHFFRQPSVLWAFFCSFKQPRIKLAKCRHAYACSGLNNLSGDTLLTNWHVARCRSADNIVLPYLVNGLLHFMTFTYLYFSL